MSKLLPVIGAASSAPTTTFVLAELTGPGDITVYFDGNSKITARNGTFDKPKPNAFSLLQIVDCPNSTPTCRKGCYVHNIEALDDEGPHRVYAANSEAIREILALPAEDVRLWEVAFARWIEANCAGGFRWHVSGDLFDPDYALFVSRVVESSPTVHHWIYTRSFAVTANFVGLKNITVNYSADQDNIAEAMRYAAASRSAGEPVRICYYTVDGMVPDDLPLGSVIFPDYTLRSTLRNSPLSVQRDFSPWFQSLTLRQKGMVCPVDFYGKSENRRCGPCSKCIDRAI